MGFLNNLVYIFFISFGVILGASFFAGLSAVINNQPPLKTMIDISKSIKLWAVIVGLGGTFSSFQAIEQGLLRGEIRAVIRQLGYIIAALTGSNLGCLLVSLLRRCWKLWY